MNRLSSAAIAFAASCSFASVALAETPQEIGYKQNALAVAAIMQGDYVKAEAQLRNLDGVSQRDPAWLINMGQVYAHTGRLADAEVAYKSAAAVWPTVDVILADGTVADSRVAARDALRRLNSTYAAR